MKYGTVERAWQVTELATNPDSLSLISQLQGMEHPCREVKGLGLPTSVKVSKTVPPQTRPRLTQELPQWDSKPSPWQMTSLITTVEDGACTVRAEFSVLRKTEWFEIKKQRLSASPYCSQRVIRWASLCIQWCQSIWLRKLTCWLEFSPKKIVKWILTWGRDKFPTVSGEVLNTHLPFFWKCLHFNRVEFLALMTLKSKYWSTLKNAKDFF